MGRKAVSRRPKSAVEQPLAADETRSAKPAIPRPSSASPSLVSKPTKKPSARRAKADQPPAKSALKPASAKPKIVRAKAAKPKAVKSAAADTSASKPAAAEGDAPKAAPRGKSRPQKPEPNPSASSFEQTAHQDDANPFLTPEVERFAQNMAGFWEASGAALSAYMKPREAGQRAASGAEQAVDIVRTLGQVVESWLADPARVAEAQRDLAGGFLELWTGTLKRLSGQAAQPVVEPHPRDSRFKDPEWSEHPIFDFLKQAYLHTSGWAERMVDQSQDLDPHVRHKAAFYVKLIANALSPSNFVPTNPELIRETLASKGENLVRGMRMLAEDIQAGNGDLRIRQTDPKDFEVGRNLAVSPGKVIYRNELFELIQYAPSTGMVRTRPLVIVPPWINKFYILDLTPDKSLIKWSVEQGLTVFCVSWVNPDQRHADMSFDDYMRDGIMRAIDVAREICDVDQVDTVGYCVGGTLLAITLAYMAASGDHRVASATMLTAQVDFTNAGDLKVFVDEEQIAAVEAHMKEVGFLEGARMANAFNMLRSNDLIWPYVVNNYLKGKAPFPFDLLFWNSDATRMPAANHSFYLRRCYLRNDLARGRMEILGKKLNLKTVKTPIYSVATREDHIAPATSVYDGSRLFGGSVRFVLAGSGHIAGVVNPPARLKYQHWTGEAAEGGLNEWIAAAEEKPGSWWPDWRAWLAAADATMVAARVPGEGPYPAIDDAPGSYVKVKA
ncbi:class I poly(R)-hydroxyalkanoic acid synthase [Hansschlegelia quercus]|uniref:Class I poly(R)-hydroxyalkanoic acid synthase n=2 Tax=Hansschlegelia quercus TaxID=2528245 RepID=A0A4Q9GM29_9HYPH|nr:class I poly(R)-hydroxyalkanoic acid synthase [Hansschlegelia quercus]